MASKYSEETLQRLSQTFNTPQQKGAATRSTTYGTGAYGRLTEEFPTHYRSFKKMHDHQIERDERVSSAFTKSREGLINFIRELGPIPSGMRNPVLTRKHSRKGFVRGNMQWMNGDKFRTLNANRASQVSAQRRRQRTTTTA
jgi:hypothetical protein